MAVDMESSVAAQRLPDAWETPEFEEVAVAPEVTMYVAQLTD
jgi:coenzyme PQQ precursor peptide PqqA